MVLGDTDEELFWFREPRADRFEEIVANLVSVAVEHPLAEATKRESRIEEWVIVDGKPMLRCYTTTMDEILHSAKISSQTLDFELDRFEANERNYNLLRDGRMQGKRQTFIEFSPSPEITDEAFERGYEGRDTIFFFEIDDKGRETITQRWLMSPRSEYVGLLETLGQEYDENATDVDIMNKSGFFTDEQVASIEAFIDGRVGKILAHQNEFDSYIKGELTPFLVHTLREPLHSAAEKLIRGEDISFEMKIMENELKYAQAKMTTYIFEQTGERIDGHILEKSEIANLDANWGARQRYVEVNDLPLLACDMSSKLRSRPTFFMSMGEMVKAWTKGEDEFGPSTFACPNCGKILTRGEGEIRSSCDSKDEGGCGGAIKKC